MAVLSSAARDNLPDSAFAYIEPGGKKVNGKTVPGKLRHYPVHDANHVRAALSRAGQGNRFAKEAMPKILAAAKRHGVEHEAASSGTGRSFESMYPEVRYIGDVPEIRSAGEDQPTHIAGYAAAFGKLSRRMGGFVERVMPGAFDVSLRSVAAGDVNLVCRFNHKDDMLLGTTQAGTLSLAVDERGLTYDVIPPSCRADVLEYVQRGDVRYSSFAFRCLVPGTDDEWGVSDFGLPLRSLHNTELVDTAPVTDPAYRDTTAVARSMTGAIESLAMWVDAEPAEVRSMLEAGQASRFFKRTDQPASHPLAPKYPVPEAGVMLDDGAIALRNWSYADDDSEDRAAEEEEEQRERTPEEILEHAEETRAMHNADTMCRKWVDGEPCVQGAGHDGDCAGRCYGHPGGLPCAMVSGHGGTHQPMEVDDGAGRGPGRPRTRDAEGTEAAQAEENRTLTGPEALAAVFAMRGQLTVID
jgi:uncharacterized protein